MVIGDTVIPCGIKNALLYFKSRVPTDEEIEKLQPVVLTQGEVPWDPRREENNAPILDDFYKEVLAATEADALAERQEEEVSVFKVPKNPKIQEKVADSIYSRLVQMTHQFQE